MEHPAVEAEVVGIEDADVPAGRLPSFKIRYHKGNLGQWDLWYSPHLGNWVKQTWDGGAKWLKLAEFWWFSLEEALSIFPDETMKALTGLIRYDFGPDRAWALPSGASAGPD